MYFHSVFAVWWPALVGIVLFWQTAIIANTLSILLYLSLFTKK